MSVRVTILPFLFGAMVLSAVLLGGLALGGTSAAERSGPSAAPASAANDFPVASDVRLGGDDTQTRLIVDLSQKIDIRAFTLANPYRVVLDMPQVTFQFPPKAGEVGRGLIKAFRFGLVMQGGSRMVIDLARPAQVDMAFVLGAANDQPARLVLHLTATDREAFMRSVALESRAPEGSKPQTPPETKVNGDSRPLVVIDPGHGGIDNGTRAASGEMEKTIVLEFSLLLRDKIEKTGKYRLHALGTGLGRPRRAPRRGREPSRRDRRARSLGRGEGRRRHSHRSRPARNQDLFGTVRPDGRRDAQECHPVAPASAEVRPLCGAQGARCALGPGGTRLCLEPGGLEIADFDRVAGPHRGLLRPGDRCILWHAVGRGRPELTGLWPFSLSFNIKQSDLDRRTERCGASRGAGDIRPTWAGRG